MQRAGKKFPSEMKKRMDKAANIIVRETQLRLNRHTHPVGTPRPATFPQNELGKMSGDLQRRITSDVTRGGRSIKAEVGPVFIKYARRHELGTRGMPKRPYLEPSVKATEDQVFEMIGQTFKVI